MDTFATSYTSAFISIRTLLYLFEYNKGRAYDLLACVRDTVMKMTENETSFSFPLHPHLRRRKLVPIHRRRALLGALLLFELRLRLGCRFLLSLWCPLLMSFAVLGLGCGGQV